ncbi:MAG: IS200/IS605 family element transposase accessory protein TnpB [Pyrinomonadaceae bacterium]|nr:IS200/IS605 family element transposase accessory protein TnpB [Pyrinomonadaceae bacterium]
MSEQRITYRYRLFPTRTQVEALTVQLSEACRLYNACLQERRDAWRINRESVNYYTQASQLKEIRAHGDLSLANFSACQDVLRRVDKTFKAFFSRVQKKQKAGFPRFKSHTRFDSLTFPSYGDGCKLIQSKLRLQGIGLIKVKLHRGVEGKIKTVTVKRECGKWYACFSVECEAWPLPDSLERVGVDVGLSAFATLSDGTEIENPRWYRAAQAKLRRAQRKVTRRQKGSHRRRKAIQLLQRAHAHVKQQRADFHHKISRWLVNGYGLIAVEDLNIKGLASGMLAKSVNDAGWGTFLDKIAYKAENAGRQFFRVNPNGTSQTCTCGASTPKTLRQRWHHCLSCGLSANRDHVSAQVILQRTVGLTVQASSSIAG